jgi:hypothetical protein
MGDKVKGRLPILSENEGTVIITVRSRSNATPVNQLLIQVKYSRLVQTVNRAVSLIPSFLNGV